MDREEFYRLKKVANKKQRDTAEADAEMKAKKEAAEAKGDKENAAPQESSGDILGTADDEDVIF